MITNKSMRKFAPQRKQIEALEKECPRFKRIFSEYEAISDDLWEKQNSTAVNIPDDFFAAMESQTDLLEHVILDLLQEKNTVAG